MDLCDLFISKSKIKKTGFLLDELKIKPQGRERERQKIMALPQIKMLLVAAQIGDEN
jgi:hypothetical protein